MTNLKFFTRRAGISAISARAAILVLITGMLLSSCTGLKSSSATVSQGSAGEALVKPSSANSAVLTELHGTVEVNTGSGEWTLAKSGQSLKSGQQIRTGALSNGTLVFYDGSRLNLGSEAEIFLDELDAPTSGARIIQLTQVSGESQHDVALSDDPGSLYAVGTPAGTGSATGTKFTVMVFPDQLSQFNTVQPEIRFQICIHIHNVSRISGLVNDVINQECVQLIIRRQCTAMLCIEIGPA